MYFRRLHLLAAPGAQVKLLLMVAEFRANPLAYSLRDLRSSEVIAEQAHEVQLMQLMNCSEAFNADSLPTESLRKDEDSHRRHDFRKKAVGVSFQRGLTDLCLWQAVAAAAAAAAAKDVLPRQLTDRSLSTKQAIDNMLTGHGRCASSQIELTSHA